MPKPLLQKLTPEDDSKHFLQSLNVSWAKAMAAYTALSSEDGNNYFKKKDGMMTTKRVGIPEQQEATRGNPSGAHDTASTGFSVMEWQSAVEGTRPHGG